MHSHLPYLPAGEVSELERALAREADRASVAASEAVELRAAVDRERAKADAQPQELVPRWASKETYKSRGL
jgi:hypothetical protein